MDREWLENYISMARECEHRQERLARMKSAEVLPPLQAGNDGSQHTGSSGEHMARSVEKRLEYEEQIAPILAENRRRMRAVEHAVCTLPPRERDILRMRYMDSDTSVSYTHLDVYKRQRETHKEKSRSDVPTVETTACGVGL